MYNRSEIWVYDQEIQTFDQFLPQTVIFLVKPNPNTLDFEPKFEEKNR
jgi:hypothetical protein